MSTDRKRFSRYINRLKKALRRVLYVVYDPTFLKENVYFRYN